MVKIVIPFPFKNVYSINMIIYMYFQLIKQVDIF